MPDSPAFPVRPSAADELTRTDWRSSLAGSANIAAKGREPAPILGRLVVLFAALVAIKVVLIVSQGQNLYEAHWRIGASADSWINFVAFFVFVALGGWSLLRLGKECCAIGLKSLRAANAVVLALGLSFIFLTFHNGEKNYFYPIISGVLKWPSLGSYVANSLFFNQPFLAGWLFVYAAIYYVLARTGREARVMSVTALFGCLYALIYLQELMLHRDELLIIDGFGIACLALSAVSRGERVSEKPDENASSSWPQLMNWLLGPLIWTVCFTWAVLRFDTHWQSNPARYLLGLITLTVILFTAGTIVLRYCGNPRSWSWYLSFFAAAFFLLTDTNYGSWENYNHLFCLAATLPRYFLGDLGVLTLLGLGAWCYRKVRPGGGLWWLDVVAVLLIVLALVDLRLSQIMGVRLGWDVLSFGDSPKMMLRMAKPYLPGAIGGLVAVLLLYALALRAVRGWAPVATAWAPGPGVIYLSVLFVLLGLLGLSIADTDKVVGQPVLRLVQTSPLWKRVANHPLSREAFLASAKSLGLGDFSLPAMAGSSKPQRDLNVLIVFMESSYNKHLSLFGSSEETQPLLSEYKNRMELFPNFFSAFAGSIHARFATFTSLYPVSDFHAFTQERVPVKSLFEVLHEHGYSCSLFYSSYLDYTGFRDLLKNRGLEAIYDADTMPGQRKTERVEWGLAEEETLGAMRGQLQQYAREHRRFCLTYVPAAPHYPYDKIPKRFQKHKVVEVGDFTPSYLNELLYMDWIIASILDELKQSDLLDSTLVVITNDHGEMVGGKDAHIGHGWAITPELANTPLIIMDPARPGFQVNKTIGTQVDFLPTILDCLNIEVPTDQLYEGQSLYATGRCADRCDYLNSYKQFAMISRDQLLLGDREGSGPNGVAAGVFSISNDGTKTIFNESSEPEAVQDRRKVMEQFGAFQANLLRNYDHYRALLRGTSHPLAKGSGG